MKPNTRLTQANGYARATIIQVIEASRPAVIATQVVILLRAQRAAEIQTIGARAVNVAVKAIAQARSTLEDEGLDITCTPQFMDGDQLDQSAVRFVVAPCAGLTRRLR